MKNVKVYEPDVKVTLYKMIKRTTLDGTTPVSTRFEGLKQKIDLTPFLSESRGLRTSKSVRDPAGGFSLTVGDKPYNQAHAFETLYGVIEPMDFIEIRMRHGTPAAASSSNDPTRPPIIMRGFVSEVTRNETMGEDGRPQRSVVISGQDYGKLWQMLQILYLPGFVIGQDILSNFKLFERYGAGLKTVLECSDFVAQIIQKIVNPYLANLIPSNLHTDNSPVPSQIKLDISVTGAITSVTGPQNQEGTIYNLTRTYADVGIWNELYLEDREDGVYCVYRPNPAQDVNGKPIQQNAPTPTIVDLSDVDVLSMSLSRTDANVANFYWVRAPRFEMVGDITMKLFALQGSSLDTVLLENYPNARTDLYGLRVMYGQTEMGPDGVSTFNSGQKASDTEARDTATAGWVSQRREIMIEQNKDNVVLERGTLRVRGNEGIKAGYYVRLKRGAFTALYYVVQVDHDYIPFNGFYSTLTVERGMGFVERAKRGSGSDSPYLAELMGTLSD